MLWSYFSSIRWQDAFDIILNSYILFRLYILFRGTNVFRVITGIVILWFFQRMAFALGLIVTSWVMEGFTAVAALIIIIVFRNEIRSVLQAKNLRAILWDFSYKTGETPIEILVESIFELAKINCGALIVLPGKEDLMEYVRGGIPWNGLISKEMIASIFWHDNPVHDGAAIIQGNQITHVGTILPLSTRENIPSFYGTRHRAAIGLAEFIDALIIVVSEERGEVAVAKDGRIKTVHNGTELKRILQGHVGVSRKKSKYPQREKLEVGGAALASLIFITGVWFSFSQGLDTLTTLKVPVEYMNRNPEMEILDASVDDISVQLRGSGTLIKSLRPEQVQVKIDLSRAVAGSNTFTITQDNITLPPGVFLNMVQPSVVEATLDIPVKKELPIQVDWVGKLPNGISISSVELTPEKIVLVGGKHILDKISTIYTKKVPVNNIDESDTITVSLALTPASLKIDSGSKDKITVKYFVTKTSGNS
ncbi:conserved membrane hypothetical protein [uncultured Desulfobacterium sp.]|uniref:Diadenylate cyclase n=1 Tax=uncultured Desulfobacterium sp. TaxID=201089 RepID=A0A445MYH5_9BACT|nr:conserved membrane hypothetical protein [uncultured Desulfobacterium sp.]